MTVEIARELALQHAQNLSADIQNASNRNEHIRLTRLAEEAYAVANALTDLTSPKETYGSGLPTHY